MEGSRQTGSFRDAINMSQTFVAYLYPALRNSRMATNMAALSTSEAKADTVADGNGAGPPPDEQEERNEQDEQDDPEGDANEQEQEVEHESDTSVDTVDTDDPDEVECNECPAIIGRKRHIAVMMDHKHHTDDLSSYRDGDYLCFCSFQCLSPMGQQTTEAWLRCILSHKKAVVLSCECTVRIEYNLNGKRAF